MSRVDLLAANQTMSSNECPSPIWYHFRKTDGNKAVCRYCHKPIATSSGSTSNLRRHLKSKHPFISIEREQQETVGSSAEQKSEGNTAAEKKLSAVATNGGNVPESGTVKNLKPPVSASNQSQDLMTNFVEVVKPMSALKSRQIDVQLLRTICSGYESFSMVEDTEFRKFVSMLNPSYALPSRKTLTASLMPTVYGLMANLEQDMAEAASVALTCDGWTSVNNTSFYALTAHFFDKNLKLKSRLLECSEFSERHTADNIRLWVTKVLKRFEIDMKIVALVTDNAANMKAAASLLKLSHLSCNAHILNLIVQSAIKSSIKNVVDKSKSIVQFFNKSTHALAKLNEMQISLNMPPLKLKQECPTRWNSTLDMLNRLLSNKQAVVSTLALLDSNLNVDTHEWVVIEHATKILKLFDDLTVEISAENNVSLPKTTVLFNILVKHVRQSSGGETKLPPVIKK